MQNILKWGYSKSDNVNVILEKICTENNIKPEECTYWGDEYVGIEKDIFGSDSFMKTEKSQMAIFMMYLKLQAKDRVEYKR